MSRSSTPILIDDEHAAFMQSGVSISLAACSPENMPCAARAYGCRLSDHHRRLTVLLWRTQAAPLTDYIRQTGKVAVVFSFPPTHRTMQFKGSNATIADGSDLDRQVASNYREAFVQVLVQLGYEERLMRAFLACPPDDIAAVTFTVEAAYTQTPGPQAGGPLKARQ